MAKSSAAQIAARAEKQSSASKKTKGDGKASSVSFEPAEGGLVSRTSRHSGGKGEYIEPTVAIHPNMAHAVGHLKSTFDHVFGGESED
jgi:hypothetical protein